MLRCMNINIISDLNIYKKYLILCIRPIRVCIISNKCLCNLLLNCTKYKRIIISFAYMLSTIVSKVNIQVSNL